MNDSFLVDGATSAYRRPHEEVKELPKADTPARLFRRRNGKEHPDAMEDKNEDTSKSLQ